jgi:hypothetical protein
LRQNPTSAFVLGAVLVFFVLAGLYEGWSLPLAVILVVLIGAPVRHAEAGSGPGIRHVGFSDRSRQQRFFDRNLSLPHRRCAVLPSACGPQWQSSPMRPY